MEHGEQEQIGDVVTNTCILAIRVVLMGRSEQVMESSQGCTDHFTTRYPSIRKEMGVIDIVGM